MPNSSDAPTPDRAHSAPRIGASDVPVLALPRESTQRHLEWPQLYNARDLGGLPLVGGGSIRPRAVVRSDSPERLTPSGWAELLTYGIRTVVDLRDASEVDADDRPRPAGLNTVHVPIEEARDVTFWGRWPPGVDSTPLYYRAFLERFPHRVIEAVAAVADAAPGGVLLHCGAGRDRTGLVVLVLLTFAGVPAAEIAEDHALSTARLEQAWRDLGAGHQTGKIADYLRRFGTSARESIIDTVENLDAAAYLHRYGLSDRQLTGLLQRMT